MIGVYELLPPGGLDQSIVLAVLVGVWVTLLFTETRGWVFVGLDYFVSQLEDHIAEPAQWILTTLDMAAVQRRFEGQRYRYVIEQSAVYRVGLEAAPRPPPGDDPPGPGMPTRGC